jgi:hypothetical protein
MNSALRTCKAPICRDFFFAWNSRSVRQCVEWLGLGTKLRLVRNGAKELQVYGCKATAAI